MDWISFTIGVAVGFISWLVIGLIHITYRYHIEQEARRLLIKREKESVEK